jgi:hypothetical protein
MACSGTALLFFLLEELCCQGNVRGSSVSSSQVIVIVSSSQVIVIGLHLSQFRQLQNSSRVFWRCCINYRISNLLPSATFLGKRWFLLMATPSETVRDVTVVEDCSRVYLRQVGIVVTVDGAAQLCLLVFIHPSRRMRAAVQFTVLCFLISCLKAQRLKYL